MKINLRWIVQAISFIGCIYFFIKLWDRSKTMLGTHQIADWLSLLLFALMFLACLFMMAVTSYLKQQSNGTLKNRIPLFERFIERSGLHRIAPENE